MPYNNTIYPLEILFVHPKLPDNQYPIHELLRQRWSTVAFSDRPVEREKLLSLFEAVRWSPSCFNEQPWRFLIATQDHPQEFERMLECFVPVNQEWAKHAPVLAISVASLHFAHNNTPNRWAFHDVGLGMSNLILQATSFGLYVHQMGGFSVEKAQELYQIPEDYSPVAAIAIGYLGTTENLPEKLKEREVTPRHRHPLNHFIFSGNWGKIAPWVDS